MVPPALCCAGALVSPWPRGRLCSPGDQGAGDGGADRGGELPGGGLDVGGVDGRVEFDGGGGGAG